MDLQHLLLLCGLLATSFVYKSEGRLHAESIVGGDAAAKGQITYVVSFQSGGEHFCGGGILNGRHIITAAHCFIDPETNSFENDDYTVIAGVINAHDKSESHRVKVKVEKIYIPKEYDAVKDPNNLRRETADIAIVKLESDLGLNAFISKIALPQQASTYSSYENQRALISGFGDNWVKVGTNHETNKVEELCSGSCYELRFAEVNIISNQACSTFYRNIKNSHLCGHMKQRSPNSPEGVCSGDSGSPLVIGHTVVGVVSNSPLGCKENVYPAIYTRVTSYLPFISNALGGHKAADMRLAKYEVKKDQFGFNRRVLVEQ